ncbi:MAG: triphosphoribosyl-dephospho-CoA synthase [Synergistaceae bacterium]|nr:triphosphoribosyl-dephospho-CoA synthase [Synergistaceae bacterium]
MGALWARSSWLRGALDRAMTRRNLSPGGCADPFALSLFLEDTELE